MMSRKSLYGVVAVVPLAGLLGLIGCSAVTATELEGAVVSNGSAEDHMAAAMLYQSKAQQLAAEANRYETAASKIGPYEDIKGIRRGGLTTVGQVKRGAAREMEELYAVHFEKAQAVIVGGDVAGRSN
ncbi:MAG: hypothetical protein RL042_2357 [Nitrospirota bacterium]|jgi:hypothetical protein